MKSFLKVTCTAFILTSLMTACSEAKETAKVEPSKEVESTLSPEEQQQQLEIEKLEKGILFYGESVKGGDYGISVLDGSYGKTNEDSGTIKAQVEVKNVHDNGTGVTLLPLEFWVENEKTNQKVIGKALPDDAQKFTNLPQGQSIVFDVSFLIKDTEELENFYLYIDSKNDPFANAHWKLDNLDSSQS
ncbi:hypothetical protein M1E11_07940 [Bacillus sp. JZ8]